MLKIHNQVAYIKTTRNISYKISKYNFEKYKVTIYLFVKTSAFEILQRNWVTTSETTWHIYADMFSMGINQIRSLYSHVHIKPDSSQHKHSPLKGILGGWQQDLELLQKVP